MRNIKAVVQYDGSRYFGFQAQTHPENMPTVQEELELAIGGLLREPTRIYSAGRTDRGVHALGQVINFHTASLIPLERMAYAINQHLPKDVRIVSASVVPEDFHARKCALGKRYQYRVWNNEAGSVFGNSYYYHYPGELNDAQMQEACRLLEGTHNYRGFSAAGSTVKNFVRTIYYLRLRREGEWLTFDVYGNGFLYNMVRILVGTVLDIGLGRKSTADIPRVFATQNRHLAGRTAPAGGLYLKNVFYP